MDSRRGDTRRHHRLRPAAARRRGLRGAAGRGYDADRRDRSFGTIESVKAVSELFAPVTGEVVEINGSLKDSPDHVNSKPHDTWMVKVKLPNAGEVAALMDAAPTSNLVEMSRFTCPRPRYICSTSHWPARRRCRRDAEGSWRRVARRADRRSVPASIRLKAPLNLPDAESESTYLARLKTIARRTRSSAASSASAIPTRSRRA